MARLSQRCVVQPARQNLGDLWFSGRSGRVGPKRPVRNDHVPRQGCIERVSEVVANSCLPFLELRSFCQQVYICTEFWRFSNGFSYHTSADNRLRSGASERG